MAIPVTCAVSASRYAVWSTWNASGEYTHPRSTSTEEPSVSRNGVISATPGVPSKLRPGQIFSAAKS